MNCRPLWITKFLPMNSGTIVQSRAQVLIGSRLLVPLACSTFSSSRSIDVRAFFSERLMLDLLDSVAESQSTVRLSGRIVQATDDLAS